MQLVKPLVGVAGLALATGVALPSLGDSGNKFASDTFNRHCDTDTPTNDSGDLVTLVGPDQLWPPNHKFVQEPVTATSGTSGDEVTITLTPTITDATGGDGGPQNDPDFNTDPGSDTQLSANGTGSATAALELRAERSGKGEGRTYTINWTATFGTRSCSSDPNGDQDHQPFTITVPHDMRGGASWITKQ